MANIKSAQQRVVQSKKRRSYNTSKRSTIRTLIKKVNISIDQGNKIAAQHNFISMQSMLDRQARKKLIHKNKAARYKSNLSYKIKSL